MNKYIYQGFEYELPFNIKNTKDIYRNVCSILNREEEELIFSYDNIFISKFQNYQLISMGYSPDEKIFVETSPKFESFFNIIPFNYLFMKQIEKFTNVFSLKDEFSQQFFTVPQNIIIKFENSILADNEMIYKYKTTKENPFEITVNENYFLVRVYFGSFSFVCMPHNSTINNLKDSVQIYSQKINLIDTYLEYSPNFLSICHENGIMDEESIDNTNLYNFSEKVPLFEFCQKVSHESKYSIYLTIKDQENNKRLSKKYCFSIETNIYSLICLIEKDLRIDRTLFYLFDENRDKLSHDMIISSTMENNYVAMIFKVLYAYKNDTLQKYSYLTKIDEIIEFFENESVGIIINNQYVFSNKSKFLLIHFLNNSNKLDYVTKIIIKYPKKKCHLLTIKNRINKRKENFIIGDYLSDDEILKNYLNTSSNIKIYKHDLKEFEFNFNEIFYCDFIFNFSSGKQYSHSIIFGRINPNVMNFLSEVYNALQKKIFKKYEMAEVFIDGKSKSFWERMFPMTKNTAYVKLIGHESQETIFILNIYNNKNIFCPFHSYDKNLTVENIIDSFCKSNEIINNNHFVLFSDFNQLNQHDIPSLILQKDFLIFANTLEDEKTFIITNETELKATLHISRKTSSFSELSNTINSMFELDENQTEISAIINKKEYKLPYKFDAGSFPDKTEFIIRYQYEKINKITFNFNGKIIILNVIVDRKIDSIKSIVLKEFKLFNISKNSIDFVFFDFVLSPSNPFSFYRIPSKAVVFVVKNENSFPIFISLPENEENKEYYFNQGEKLEDVKNHFKSMIKPDFEMFFYLKSDKKTKLKFEMDLVKDLNIYLVCKRIRIKTGGSLEEKEIKISEILTISDAILYIETKLNQKNVFIYTKNEADKSYEPADDKKKLFEFNCNLYAHLYVSNIKFNYDIFDKNSLISELNTVYYLKKNFLSKILLTSPENIQINYKEKIIPDSTKVGKLSERNINISINEKIVLKSPPIKNKRINFAKDTSDLKNKPIDGKKERPKSSMKPKVKPIISPIKEDSIKLDDESELISFLNGNLNRFVNFSKIEKFNLIEKIGVGSFSEVYKAVYLNHRSKFFAFKTLNKNIFKQTEEKRINQGLMLLREFDILRNFDHPNIIKTFGFFNGDKKHATAIILEYFPYNLNNIVKGLTSEEKLNVITEISEVMKCVHKSNIIHLNLKPENILLNKNKHVKIGDFHSSTFFDYNLNSIIQLQLPEKGEFTAPELLNDENDFNEKVDVYSFGVLVFFILSVGMHLDISLDDVKNGKMPKIPYSFLPEYAKLIRKCLCFNPKDRFSFGEICQFIDKNRLKLIS